MRAQTGCAEGYGRTDIGSTGGWAALNQLTWTYSPAGVTAFRRCRTRQLRSRTVKAKEIVASTHAGSI